MKLRRRELKRARIEIIPMIDTIFFLLVFFMITSLSMVQVSAKKVDLPQSQTAHDRPQEKVVVSLDAQNQYYVDRQPVNFADILPTLQQKVKENPNVTVILNCDRSHQAGDLLRIMDIAKQANPGSLEMATTPRIGGAGS